MSSGSQVYLECDWSWARFGLSVEVAPKRVLLLVGWYGLSGCWYDRTTRGHSAPSRMPPIVWMRIDVNSPTNPCPTNSLAFRYTG